uniref:Si:ch73-343l4.8 n=1 Tax=Sinocyclocheilus anshuiensis TaxID=1608454 RepID=A0A671NU61_9TELE
SVKTYYQAQWKMDLEAIYENVERRDTENTTGPQTQRGSRCLVLITVGLGLICVLLLFNQTINSLQDSYTDLMIEKHQLQNNFNTLSQKNLDKIICVCCICLLKGNGMLFMSTELKSWSDSRQYCRDRGADLVIINTEEKQRLVYSLFKERVWIGLSDRQQEGNMKWVDNSPLKQGFWESNEPNDAGGNENCIELNPAKSVLNNWNDIPCSATRKWICENQRPILHLHDI